MKLIWKVLKWAGIGLLCLIGLGVVLEMTGVDESSPGTSAQVAAPAPAPARRANEVPDEVRNDIIDRCRRQMEDIGGAAIVRVCVDEDVAAYRALQSYDAEWRTAMDRCQRQMLSIGGWAIVKVCVDEDIAAERSLR